jgi:phospholipid/cholesterol/gamma-HCH transport system substrate-binding protein
VISRRIRVQLALFLVITVLGVVYAGLRYAGFHPFGLGSPYMVTAYFRTTGGMFPGSQVTERGDLVGTVTAVNVDLVHGGVAATLAINPQFKIPCNSTAKVANLSAVGENYVDITPRTSGPPYLHFNGCPTIPVTATSVPINDATLLLHFEQLIRSVSIPQLQTVIAELGKAFHGTGPDLQQLIDAGDALTKAAQQNLPTDVALLNEGRTVLDTQNALNAELQTFTANLVGLSHQLVASDPDLRAFLDNGVVSAQELQTLLQDNQTDLPVLLANLVTLGQIQAVRIPALQTVLTIYPADVANGFLTAQAGHAHFGLVTTSTQAQPVCTQGYLPPAKQRGNSSPPDWSGPANLNTYCTEPPSGPATVRGSRNSPFARQDGTAGPPPGGYQQLPGATYPSQSPSPAPVSGPVAAAGGPGRSTSIAPYDPLSGLIAAPNGRTYELGDTGGQSQIFGSVGWEWLLLAPVLG